MNSHKSVLLKSLGIIKPNFHAFTARFHKKLEQSDVSMKIPSAEQFNEKSYILYCTLERIIKNIDNPSSVAPFLSHHLQYLKKLNIQQNDIKPLTDIFYITLVEHLGRLFNEDTHLAWRNVLTYFERFTNDTLFNVSNVVCLNELMQQKRSNN
jgi:hemoglobin-like flavoprotein